jgi:hypothetical protein
MCGLQAKDCKMLYLAHTSCEEFLAPGILHFFLRIFGCFLTGTFRSFVEMVPYFKYFSIGFPIGISFILLLFLPVMGTFFSPNLIINQPRPEEPP